MDTVSVWNFICDVIGTIGGPIGELLILFFTYVFSPLFFIFAIYKTCIICKDRELGHKVPSSGGLLLLILSCIFMFYWIGMMTKIALPGFLLILLISILLSVVIYYIISMYYYWTIES